MLIPNFIFESFVSTPAWKIATVYIGKVLPPFSCLIIYLLVTLTASYCSYCTSLNYPL
jgi:hypothetical protein